MGSSSRVRELVSRWWGVPVLLGVAAVGGWGIGSGEWGQPEWRGREWTIGTDNARPYHFMRADGTTGGMIADVMNEAAKRSEVKLKWVVRPEGPAKAIGAGRVDIWPLLSVQKEMWPEFHFTKPYLKNSYVLVCPRDCDVDSGRLKVRRVAVVNYPLVRKLAGEAFPAAEKRLVANREEAMGAACRGEADGAFMESRAVQYMMLHRPAECRPMDLHSYGMNVPSTELALASTDAGAAAAERLREEIDGMLADGTMGRLMRKWNYYYSGESEALFGEERARRASRVAQLLAGTLGLVVVALLVLMARMREARREAQAASAAKTQFLATMSHEIRTPLHGLLGMSQLLKESRLEGEQREYVEMLEHSGRTLLTLVNDVLDLERVERGKVELCVAAYEPAKLFAAELRAWEAQARAKAIELRAEGWERLPERALGDEARIRQVVANLLSNAMKFTARGSITLAVEVQGSGEQRVATVEVRDTGIGIAADSLARIFEQFSQADQTISRRYGGTGLGLSIARRLVELMGGAMAVESEPGVGTKFRFTLPMLEARSEARGEGRSPAGAAQARGAVHWPSCGRARVLLVEDNAVNQRIAQKILEKAGCEVETVDNGQAALEALERGSYCAVFMDCQMPVMDGLTATRELRRLGRQVPVIALTASAMAAEKERCLQAGMDDYLTKPMDLAELDRVLRRWVRGESKCDTLAHIR